MHVCSGADLAGNHCNGHTTDTSRTQGWWNFLIKINNKRKTNMTIPTHLPPSIVVRVLVDNFHNLPNFDRQFVWVVSLVLKCNPCLLDSLWWRRLRHICQQEKRVRGEKVRRKRERERERDRAMKVTRVRDIQNTGQLMDKIRSLEALLTWGRCLISGGRRRLGGSRAGRRGSSWLLWFSLRGQTDEWIKTDRHTYIYCCSHMILTANQITSVVHYYGTVYRCKYSMQDKIQEHMITENRKTSLQR